MKVTPSSIPGALILDLRNPEDELGFFFESYGKKGFDVAVDTRWPIAGQPLLSEKDALAPAFASAEHHEGK